MQAIIKSILVVTILSGLSACNSAPEQADVPQQTIPESSADKVKTLSAYKPTQIETSNGTITVQPTVVATTDEVNERLEINSETEYYDPLEFINRPLFTFNHYTYKYALIPLSKGYKAVLPEPVRDSVSKAFDNIREPLNLLNNGLSGEFSEAGNNLGRFLINSTVGVFGLFDPASSWFGIEKKPQSFAQTLMKYDVGSGAYIVLPLLGQSDLRGTTSVISESLIHPTQYIFGSPEDTAARAVDAVDDFSRQADLYVTLFEQSDDPYIYFRNQYIQSTNRDEMAETKVFSEVNIVGDQQNE